MVTKKIISSILLISALTFGVGCNPGIIEPPASQVKDPSIYFWKQTALPLNFVRTTNTSTSEIPIVVAYEKQDSIGYFIKESLGNGTIYSDLISCLATGDILSMRNLTSHSIIPIPDGFYVNSTKMLLSEQFAPKVTHILAVKDLTVIASTDTSGMFYSKDGGVSWTLSKGFEGIGKDNSVTTLAVRRGDIADTIYVGTKNGNLYFSIDHGATFGFAQNLGAEILASTIDPLEGKLIVSVLGKGVFILPGLTTKGAAIKTSQTFSITSLACFRMDTNSTVKPLILVGATASNGLYLYKVGYTDWIHSTNGPAAGDPVFSIIATPSMHVFCSSYKGAWYSVGGTSWRYSDTIYSAKLSYDITNKKTFAGGEKGGMFTIADPPQNITNAATVGQSIIHRVVLDVSAALNSTYYVATDSGIFISSDGARSWHQSGGLTSTRNKYIEIQDNITLLKMQSGGLSIGSSWLAGKILGTVTGTTLSLDITGRIVDHLDSLGLRDSVVYKDVFVVRYAYELTPGSIDQKIPQIIVYYAKDEGPVLIDQILPATSTLLSRTFRKKR